MATTRLATETNCEETHRAEKESNGQAAKGTATETYGYDRIEQNRNGEDRRRRERQRNGTESLRRDPKRKSKNARRNRNEDIKTEQNAAVEKINA